MPRRVHPRQGGFLLPEMLISALIMGIMVLAVVSFTMFSGRSFAALFNYVELNDDNRIAIDQLTSDVRQADMISNYTTNSITLRYDGVDSLVYYYSPSRRILFRIKNDVSKIILRDCEWLRFELGQRNTIQGTYEVFPAATAATAKVVNVSWVCSRTVFGNRANSESVQTARIVIRKQGT